MNIDYAVVDIFHNKRRTLIYNKKRDRNQIISIPLIFRTYLYSVLYLLYQYLLNFMLS